MKRPVPFVQRATLALLTPLLEKNVMKTASLDVPVVFSMSRLIVLSFAVAMLRQVWKAGIAGWPDATLAIAIVLALPIVGALERCPPEQVVGLTKTLLNRFGAGAVRELANVYAPLRPLCHPEQQAKDLLCEPSKFDDHLED